MRKFLLVGSAAMLLSATPLAFAATPVPTKTWTIDAIATAPEIEEVVISADGKTAAYIALQANLQQNANITTVHVVDVKTRADRVVAEGRDFSALTRGTDSDSWNFLGDIDRGVQLYSASLGQAPTLVLENKEVVSVGRKSGALDGWAMSAPKSVGIVFYAWSPDRQTLWYATQRELPWTPVTRSNQEVVELSGQYIQRKKAVVDFHVRTPDGRDQVIDERPGTDVIAFAKGGQPSWTGNIIGYLTMETSPHGGQEFKHVEWNPTTGAKTIRDATLGEAYHGAYLGPNGGALATTGFGKDRDLTETLDGRIVKDYGKVDFFLGDARASGNWLSPDGSLAIVGTRSLFHPAEALAVIDRAGVQPIAGTGSLRLCDFTPALDTGVCVNDGLNMPPRLVRIDTATKKIVALADLAPVQSTIAPLRVESRTWTNRHGTYSTGFVIYPRDYVPGRAYPTIVVTHGSDADEQFLKADMQWEFPVQVLAEQGYLVVLANDPASRQNAELSQAMDEWFAGKKTDPKRVQDRVWFDTVDNLEDAVASLVKEGLVMPGKVGIAGFSRGSQVTSVAITHSTVFSVAASDEGGYLEPSMYMGGAAEYDAVYGGSPYDPAAIPFYKRLAPSLNAANAGGPILQQVVQPAAYEVDFYQALLTAHIPTQLTLYPGEDVLSQETHVFHIPSNRVLAMNENLDWFNFWLLGKEDHDPMKVEEYKRWNTLKAQYTPNRADPGK